jgi:uncharacterized protein (TIGR00255 family)
MTGFARAAGSEGAYGWIWEMRSVNGRSLDVRLRLPAGFEHLEAPSRTEAAKRFSRGNIAATLTLERREGAAQLRLNRAALDQLIALASEYKGHGGVAPAQLDGLLAVRGVVEVVEQGAEAEDARAAREATILASLSRALDELAIARRQEGRALAVTLTQHLDEIESLVAAASANAATQPTAIKARLQAQLIELLGAENPVSPDRLAQEVAMMATRADVREELDRLRAHIVAARQLLGEGGAVGRRLDFLSQEFNREANTLCSKSADIELTRIGLSLKAVIDRLREQAANIE